ncbi:MAG: DUF7507 domain-containing protein, partial [Actinomycetota bacterium]
TGPATATRGQAINYTLTVTNPGNISINNVVVTDNKCDAAPVLQTKTGNGDNALDVGEVWTYTCSRITSNADPSPFVNLATATGTGTNGQQVTDTDDHSVTLSAAALPTIRINKTGPAEAQRGDTITYTLEVTIPSGNLPLTNITVSDPRCDAAPVLQSKTGGDQDDTLEAGELWTYKCSHRITNSDPNPLPNTATATGTGPNNEPVEDEDSHLVDVVPNAAIRIQKDAQQKAKVGDTITYTLEVSTPVDRPLHDINVSDPKCDGAPKLQSKLGGDNDNLLELGEVWVYTCDHKVTNADLGVLKNVAEVSGRDDDNDKVTDKDSEVVDVTEVERKIIEKPPPVDEPLPFTGVDVTYPLLVAVGLLTAGTLSLILSGRDSKRRRIG